MKVAGNMALATRFAPGLFPKLGTDAPQTGGLAANATAADDGNDGKGFESEEVYNMFKAAVEAKGPQFVKQVKGVIAYVLTNGPGGKKWTFYTDLKNGSGSIAHGKPKKRPNLTVTVKVRKYDTKI